MKSVIEKFVFIASGYRDPEWYANLGDTSVV